MLALPAAVSADPGDIGYEGPDGTGAGAAPTGSKPQAKVWFNDGIWWGSMWDVGTSDFYIWKLDRGTQTWTRTATRLDERNATRADVLWDGARLYVASHSFSESDGTGVSRLYRFSYNSATDTYTSLGAPTTINSVRSETLVIDKDSTGALWATWEQGGRIWVNRTHGGDSAWGTPFILPGSPTVSGDDISTLIAFGGNKIGVMWSNQNASPDADQFAFHVDGQPDTTWSSVETALAGTGLADDHLSLKTDASGKVYAAVKTGLSGSSPLIKFLVRATNGTWTDHTVATGSESHTRPILVVDEQHSLFRIYMTHGQSGGPIVEKTSPMSAISWPSGTGTRVIWDASSNDMNNPASTKQNVTAASGLIVVAFEDTTKRYWHGDILGGGGPPPPDTTPPTVSARTPAPDATDVATTTNVTATFSEPVTGVSGTSFWLEGPSGAVPASVTYSPATQTATLDPTAELATSTTYTAHLTGDIRDAAASPNALAPVSWSFTTAAAPPPPPPPGSGIAFRSASSAGNTATTSLVLPKPAGVIAGDVLLAAIGARGNPDITAPAGWTLVREDISGSTIRQVVFVKVAGSSEPADYTFDLSNAQTASGGIVAYSGVDPADPIDAHGGQANLSSTALEAPSITTTGPDRMLVALYAIATPTSQAPPAGMTERYDEAVTSTRYKASAGGHDELVAAVGATGTRTATSDKSGINIGQLVALRPGSTTPPPPDTTPPTVTGRTPAPDATGVTATTNVTATFSEAVTGVSGTTFTLEPSGGSPIGATVTYDGPTRTATLDPTADLAPDTTYTARLTAGISDTASPPNALAPVSWSFTTAPAPPPPPPDTTPPTVTGRTPAPDATGVAATTNVTATFSEAVTGVSGTTFTLEPSGGSPIGATVTYDGPSRTATLDPTADLAPDTTYTARLTAGISDTASPPNALAPVSWSFTTASAPPPPPPGGGIAFRSASSAGNTATASLVIPAPAGIVAGDVLLAAIGVRGNPDITAPTGWTLVRLDINANTMRQAVFVKVAGTSEPGSYTFDLSKAHSAAGGIVAFSGVDASAPIDAEAGGVNARSTSITAPSVTTSGPDRMLVGFFGVPSQTSIDDPASMTASFDQSGDPGNTYKVTTGAAHELVPGAGATGDRVAASAANTTTIGQLVALRPGSTTPPPPDTTPPTVTGRTPAPDATGVTATTNVTATFSEAVTGVSGTTFTLEPSGGSPIGATVTYDGPTRTATLDPTADLAPDTTYTARLTAGISDTASPPNALAPVSWSFTTAPAPPPPPPDTTPPTVTGRTPASGATNVVTTTNVTATFSEAVTGVSGTTFTLEPSGGSPIGATVTYDGPTRTATLDPTADLAPDTTYTARLTAGIGDTASPPNALAPVSWSFTTAAAPPPPPPGGGIAFRSASSAGNTATASLVIPAPAGIVAGDVLLAAVGVRGNPDITAPTGWTLVRLDINANTMRQAVFVKVAGTSEPGSYTFDLSKAHSAAGGIVAFSGVDASAPIDAAAGGVNARSTSITAPSVTTSGPDRMLVGFFGVPSQTSIDDPASMTASFDQSGDPGNTYKVTTGAAHELVPGAGATGDRVAASAANTTTIGQLVALRPAP